MNRVNYQKEMEGVLARLDGHVPRLLLHVCCAPCSSYVLEYLSQYFEITVFYYNPNIEPEAEYSFRAAEERRLIGEMSPLHPIRFMEGKYEPELFHQACRGLEREPEGGARCTECFRLRLERSAQACREGGYDFFTTTLTISPLKDADRLNAIGREMADKYGVRWLPGDFKKRGGYVRSVELSREHGLYRQDFCGCAYSRAESLARKQALACDHPCHTDGKDA